MLNVYVSLSGNDDNDGTIDNPVKSLSKAIDLCDVNGNIYMNDGTYLINVSTEYKVKKVWPYTSHDIFTLEKSVNIIAINKGLVEFIGNLYLTFNIPISNIIITFIGIDFSNDINQSYAFSMYSTPGDTTIKMNFYQFSKRIPPLQKFLILSGGMNFCTTK
jgi:hypothetical protein